MSTLEEIVKNYTMDTLADLVELGVSTSFLLRPLKGRRKDVLSYAKTHEGMSPKSITTMANASTGPLSFGERIALLELATHPNMCSSRILSVLSEEGNDWWAIYPQDIFDQITGYNSEDSKGPLAISGEGSPSGDMPHTGDEDSGDVDGPLNVNMLGPRPEGTPHLVVNEVSTERGLDVWTRAIMNTYSSGLSRLAVGDRWVMEEALKYKHRGSTLNAIRTVLKTGSSNLAHLIMKDLDRILDLFAEEHPELVCDALAPHANGYQIRRIVESTKVLPKEVPPQTVLWVHTNNIEAKVRPGTHMRNCIDTQQGSTIPTLLDSATSLGIAMPPICINGHGGWNNQVSRHDLPARYWSVRHVNLALGDVPPPQYLVDQLTDPKLEGPLDRENLVTMLDTVGVSID